MDPEDKEKAHGSQRSVVSHRAGGSQWHGVSPLWPEVWEQGTRSQGARRGFQGVIKVNYLTRGPRTPTSASLEGKPDAGPKATPSVPVTQAPLSFQVKELNELPPLPAVCSP